MLLGLYFIMLIVMKLLPQLKILVKKNRTFYNYRVKKTMKALIMKELEKKSQSELARDIHISQPTIHKILYTETKQSIPTVKLVAKYFGLPISYFLESTEEQASQEELATITADEQEILRLFRDLRSVGAAQEAFNFLTYLLMKTKGNGPKIKKIRSST